MRRALLPFRSWRETSLASRALRKLPVLGQTALLYDYANRPHTTCSKALKSLGRESFAKLKRFAICRDPLDWLFSCYKFFLLGGSSIKGSLRPSPSSFEVYIDQMLELGDDKPSQAMMVCDYQGRLLVDRIGLYHRLDDFYEDLKGYLKVRLPPLQHLNHNPFMSRASVPHISTELLAKIQAGWCADWEIWELAQSVSGKSVAGCQIRGSFRSSLGIESYDPWGAFSWTSGNAV